MCICKYHVVDWNVQNLGYQSLAFLGQLCYYEDYFEHLKRLF